MPSDDQSPGPTGRGIKLLLVDDHFIIRQALRLLLESQDAFEVVGAVENGREAVQEAERLRPDVVLMDMAPPGLNGIEATRQIRRRLPATRVLMLVGFVDEDQLRDSLRAGASGYVVSQADVAELVVAVQTVSRGNTYFSSSLGNDFDLTGLLNQAKWPEARTTVDVLTSREREVLQLIAEGHTNQGVADELYISVKTVEAHKSHIMAKLRARNRTDLIRFALRKGIIRTEHVAEAQRILAVAPAEGREPDL